MLNLVRGGYSNVDDDEEEEETKAVSPSGIKSPISPIVPKALTDFVFDLYDSVTLSHITEEQRKLYNTDFRDLSSKLSRNS